VNSRQDFFQHQSGRVRSASDRIRSTRTHRSRSSRINCGAAHYSTDGNGPSARVEAPLSAGRAFATSSARRNSSLESPDPNSNMTILRVDSATEQSQETGQHLIQRRTLSIIEDANLERLKNLKELHPQRSTRVCLIDTILQHIARRADERAKWQRSCSLLLWLNSFRVRRVKCGHEVYSCQAKQRANIVRMNASQTSATRGQPIVTVATTIAALHIRRIATPRNSPNLAGGVNTKLMLESSKTEPKTKPSSERGRTIRRSRWLRNHE
jgi:hypothetical protein